MIVGGCGWLWNDNEVTVGENEVTVGTCDGEQGELVL